MQKQSIQILSPVCSCYDRNTKIKGSFDFTFSKKWSTNQWTIIKIQMKKREMLFNLQLINAFIETKINLKRNSIYISSPGVLILGQNEKAKANYIVTHCAVYNLKMKKHCDLLLLFERCLTAPLRNTLHCVASSVCMSVRVCPRVCLSEHEKL